MNASIVTLVIFVCASFSSGSGVSIHKCCPMDQHLSRDLKKCISFPSSGTSDEFEQTFRALYTSLINEDGIEEVSIQPGLSQPCPWSRTYYLSTRLQDAYRLIPNGMLFLHPHSTNDDLHPKGDVVLGPSDYCLDRVDHKSSDGSPTLVFLTCPCSKALCFNKCCGRKSMIFIKEYRKTINPSCGKSTIPMWAPNIYTNSTHIANHSFDYFLLDNRLPDCSSQEQVVISNTLPDKKNTSFWIHENGSVLIDGFGFGTHYHPISYCGDWFQFEDGSVIENIMFCHRVSTEVSPSSEGIFYGSMFIIGSIFLVLTLIAYAILPELRRTNNAKSVICHISSLLIASICLASAQLNATISTTLCYVIPLVIQCMFLASFFWLNVLCIDITLMFSKYKNYHHRFKFLIYSLYAWGSSIIISVVTIIMEFVEEIPESVIKPDFGVKTCWFKTNMATLAYFYGPMGVLLVINLILFIYTSIKITMAYSTRINNDSSRINRERFILYIKLFIVMGLTWITEIISWLVDASYIFYVTDFINLMRGLFIFIIICCNSKVFHLVKTRFKLYGCSAITKCNKTEKTVQDSPKYTCATEHSAADTLQLDNV